MSNEAKYDDPMIIKLRCIKNRNTKAQNQTKSQINYQKYPNNPREMRNHKIFNFLRSTINSISIFSWSHFHNTRPHVCTFDTLQQNSVAIFSLLFVLCAPLFNWELQARASLTTKMKLNTCCDSSRLSHMNQQKIGKKLMLTLRTQLWDWSWKCWTARIERRGENWKVVGNTNNLTW